MTDRYKYSYLPTGSIRLLHLISLTPEVRLKVEVVSLDSHPTYNALSYCWGDDKPFKKITLEDGYVDIAQNLSICLEHLGRFAGERIWIDALCINQKDKEEKSRQVAKMAEVYEQADKVLVWLGPAADDSDSALNGILRYGKPALEAGLLEIERQYFETWPDLGDDPVRLQTKEKVQALMAKANEAESDLSRAADRFPRVAFAALSHREYFNRLWVKQEVTLAKNAILLCGFESVDIDYFHAACVFYPMVIRWEALEYTAGRFTRVPGPFSIEELEAAPTPWHLIKTTVANPAIGPLCAARRKHQISPEKRPLLELLHTSYVRSGALGLQSKEPKDKIFGLLGMVSDVEELGIVVDYKKSAEEVYEDVARGLILKQGHVDILKWCRSRRCDPPTWIPNFNDKISYTWTDEMGTPLFKATGSRTQPQHILDDQPAAAGSTTTREPLIRLQGLILDKITEVGLPFTHNADLSFDQEAARVMFKELEVFLETKSRYPPESFIDAIWRIPICDKELHATSAYYQRATDRSKEQFVLLMFQSLRNETVMGKTMSYQAVMQYQDGARVFVTESGYVGLGPQETKPGDVVSFLFGGSTPFVLRPFEELGRHMVVGETYVYGVMDGEAIEMGLEELAFDLWLSFEVNVTTGESFAPKPPCDLR